MYICTCVCMHIYKNMYECIISLCPICLFCLFLKYFCVGSLYLSDATLTEERRSRSRFQNVLFTLHFPHLHFKLDNDNKCKAFNHRYVLRKGRA